LAEKMVELKKEMIGEIESDIFEICFGI